MTLAQVDSVHWKYILVDADSIVLYNLDHSLDRVIPIPTNRPALGTVPLIVAKNLFSSDGSYAYLLKGSDSLGYNELEAFGEQGNLLFSCDTCLPYPGPINNSYVNNPNAISEFIIATDSGTKMLIRPESPNTIEVFSLPGKLPGCSNAVLGVTHPNVMGTDPSLPTSAYPNPSSGLVRIAYQLPPGVSSGEVILTTEDGMEVKRYNVTSSFSDLEIEESDLPSGSYFYRLVTTQGESAAQRIVLAK